MLATIALVAGVAFAIVALYRLSAAAAPAARHVQLAAALVAGLCGIAWWHAVGDTRWLVGGLFFLAAGIPGWLARGRRGLVVAALACGLLGVALYAVATAHPMAVTVPSPGA